MNCHQILSGACNAGDRCFAIGSVEGIPFTAYAAGCNIVILASSFERVQIIPGAMYGYIKISAIDCSMDTGKIAGSFEEKICIFEPSPLQKDNPSIHNLDYRWIQTGTFWNTVPVTVISWNLEGTRLLTGGLRLQLWKPNILESNDQIDKGVKFEIGGGDKESKAALGTSWKNIWSCQTAIPINHMAFSPDGTLFATSGNNDRLVKIWYESKHVLFPSLNSENYQYQSGNLVKSELKFNYVYIAHPRAVTNISWRKTSKYMPKGSVSNALVTCCLDNICRIWLETVLPDDGLVNLNQFEQLASQNPKFRTHRHKHKFLQRFKHMKTCFHLRRLVKSEETVNSSIPTDCPIPSLPSSYSVHDFHSYGFYGSGVNPGVHFHVAASINAETDIPLVPSMLTEDSPNQSNFILHWLNNKEMEFSLQAENLLHYMARQIIDKDESQNLACEMEESEKLCDEQKIETVKKKYIKYIQKSLSFEENISEDHSNAKHSYQQGTQYANISMSNTASQNSLVVDSNNSNPLVIDSLDMKIDCLLRDWHQSSDLLYAIHPIDGSFLIWVIDWLDDYNPGSFRQAQVSFSTRIPAAFPLGDAISMSNVVSLYNAILNTSAFKDLEKCTNKKLFSSKKTYIENSTSTVEKIIHDAKNKDENCNESSAGKDISSVLTINSTCNFYACSIVSMVTKHTNGTLNLWQLTFGQKTKFSQVLSIGHVSRVSGHRFRVNDIKCHPVLPLLLTTSHHNVSDTKSSSPRETNQGYNPDVFIPTGFCSELILWRVDAVGPLCYSGGINELARINSPQISAFSNVAWIPTLLPSTTLGSLSNSSSACFVASDGENLRVYQAVIDARTLLAEISVAGFVREKFNSNISLYSNPSSINNNNDKMLSTKIKIVSQQSTARPGCILELDAISNAKHDWQNTQFLHVFQNQLIVGEQAIKEKTKTSAEKNEPKLCAIADLKQNLKFEELFFIVILEKTSMGSTIHMWKIIIASKSQTLFLPESEMYVPDSNLIQELEDHEYNGHHLSTAENISNTNADSKIESPHIHISTEKICTQDLPMPEGVDVVHASPSAGHLSSSSIYPACLAPYIIVTACSDSISRFWKCEMNDYAFNNYKWAEWKMFSKQQDSAIEIPGQPLNISAAYSGRVACAYKYGKSFTRPTKGGGPDSRYINLRVAIYECESTGGSEWVLEDTIQLKNITLPHINVDSCLDMKWSFNSKLLQKQKTATENTKNLTDEEGKSMNFTSNTTSVAYPSLMTVPSFNTLQSLRKSITENGNTCPLTQKHLVQLDWVSKEDGSHILTVAVGSKILLYTPVSSDLAQANIKAMKESSINRPILRKSSSLAQPHFNDEIHWMKLREINLQTADGLPPLPMQLSWVRDGILVVGMDSEMHVYSQWKPRSIKICNGEDVFDTRCLRDEDIRSLANELIQPWSNNVPTIPLRSKTSTANLQLLSMDKKKKIGNSNSGISQAAVDNFQAHNYLPDYGLFQASRIACPVLPQYHPKQLMGFLNSGKIRWVKAILAHLVRCMNGSYFENSNEDSEDNVTHRQWSRSRTLSINYVGAPNNSNEHRFSTTQVPEELMLDYTEITSIPPLPLWVLLNADKEQFKSGNQPAESAKDYGELFNLSSEEFILDEFLETTEGELHREDRRPSLPDKNNLSQFGIYQAQILSRMLTHTHLPGLSSLDQMHLLALADTVATCNTEFSEKFTTDAAKNVKIKDTVHNMEFTSDSLDDCGLRFLLAMKHFTYLMRCLPINQRAQFQKQGIGMSNIVWAFHSESEEELLLLTPSYAKGEFKWSTLKEIGFGYWVKNTKVLKQCMEKLAKSAYQSNQDPLDAALYYLAMKKKSIVWGLFRSKGDEKMTAFFSNNFNENRWRKAALKNAFVLLGKQRFEHAVAFFLLANSLLDAVEVCLNKLDDFQLALIITRLYEGDLDTNAPSSYKVLLRTHILGYDSGECKQDMSKAHPDPFLRSVAFWILKDYSTSLSTLLLNNVGHNHPSYKEEDLLKSENIQTINPNVFNFYIYLRTHPLLIRQHIALSAQEKKQTVVLPCFSYNGEIKCSKENNKELQIEDSISSLERQLYFTTAHGHFKAGCPALALDVLNKLPSKVVDPSTKEEENISLEFVKNSSIAHGTLNWITSPKPDDFSSFTYKKSCDNLESQREENNTLLTERASNSISAPSSEKRNIIQIISSQKLDIMAQQLKFIACLKILMEELSTLATGFEVDGGQLRYQLYVWLEREVEALKDLCNYCNVEVDNTEQIEVVESNKVEKEPFQFQKSTNRLSLHEILMQEKLDFEAKIKRAVQRKRWLKANETLLRTLLSYCSLHGASGGGLSSVRMELIILLQELQQERTRQQLLSPLPFPTTLPLLSACVAGSKTVIADPVKYLQSHTQDMLQTIVKTRLPFTDVKDNNISEIFILRDLAISLSSCIYQSLCDSEEFAVNQLLYSNEYQSPGIENLAKLNSSCQCSHLMVNADVCQRKRKYSTEEHETVCTSPSKWPGVTNLRALLAREKDEDIPRLNVLLLEAFFATYMSLLLYALATCDCHILYRLIGKKFTKTSWSKLFGGGVRKLLRNASTDAYQTSSYPSQYFEKCPDEISGIDSSTSKQRAKSNMKLLGNYSNASVSSEIKEDKPTYREKFIPPEISLVSFFLLKPPYEDDSNENDYDTDDSFNSEISDMKKNDDGHYESYKSENFCDNLNEDNMEHINPTSYSWNILRLSTLKLATDILQEFICVAGIEIQELPVASPLLHQVLRNLSCSQDVIKEKLKNQILPSVNFIQGCFIENDAKGPAIHKYRALLDRKNTPFKNDSSTGPARRLWNHLVRQEQVQDIFIRAIFSKKIEKKAEPTSNTLSNSHRDLVFSKDGTICMQKNYLYTEPMRIIHKDQESILAFCVNNASPGLMAIATPREVQEMDISLLLDSPNWCEDECEYDILNLSKDENSAQSAGFLLIQSSSDKSVIDSCSSSQNYGCPINPQSTLGSQSGRGTTIILKHKVDNIKRMCAHPLMPLYITGGQDGSVQLWEWNHQQVVCTPRPPGTFAKVTRCRFSQQGNKFGISDGDGKLSLWQAGTTSQCTKPFFSYQCHSKTISDFVFVGSCSLFATAGLSSENKNICFWDALLPQRNSIVSSFNCHEQGASSLVYAPQHQVLISSGKRGDTCVFDIRQRTLRHRFQTHECPIKCMAMDPNEEIFATGSVDGDIKIWNLSCNTILHTFPGEHAKSSFFKHVGQGVSQLLIDSHGRMFSCGSDGSMKVRNLFEQDQFQSIN